MGRKSDAWEKVGKRGKKSLAKHVCIGELELYEHSYIYISAKIRYTKHNYACLSYLFYNKTGAYAFKYKTG